MPKFATAGNTDIMTTSGLSSTEGLPTSSSRSLQESKHSVTDYRRRVGESLFGTSRMWLKVEQSSLATSARVSGPSLTDSSLDASISPVDPTGTSRIIGLQKWAGQIHSVESGLFTVELLPLDHDGPVLFADFDLRLLAPDERKAKPGAIVYLTTRMIQGDSGRVEAVTNVRLRHPRRWSRDELNEVKRRGRDRARSFAKYANRGTER